MSDGLNALCPLTVGEPINRRIRRRKAAPLLITGDELDF
jgi:hypothetical protein